MESNPNLICPKCKQADQIQKVSSLYETNTQEWSEEELGMDVFGHIEDRQIQHEAHTKLGLKLKPPEEPGAPTQPGLWYWIGIGIAVIIIFSLCSFVVFPLAIVIPIVVSNRATLPEAFRGQNGMMLIVGIGAILFIVGLIALGILVWLGLLVKRRYTHDMAVYRDKKDLYDQEMQKYHQLHERWEQLYYCSRDAIIFIQSEDKAIPVEDMTKYLRDPYYKF
jgi:hypothetical protein